MKAKTMVFGTRQEAQAWIDENDLAMWPHHGSHGWFAVFTRPEGVFLANEDGTATLAEEW